MRNITMIHTGGPYGDCCSSYKFILDKEMTLQEFAKTIAADKREWGVIKLSPFGEILVDYSDGKITYRGNKNLVIATEGTAHGGWSNMDYYVRIKMTEKGD